MELMLLTNVAKYSVSFILPPASKITSEVAERMLNMSLCNEESIFSLDKNLHKKESQFHVNHK